MIPYLQRRLTEGRQWLQSHLERWLPWWNRHPASTRVLWRYLWRTVENFSKSGARQAAALAYYTIFSVFPFILLLAVMLNAIVGPVVAEQQIVMGIASFLPNASPEFLRLIQDNVAQALDQAQSFGIVALLGLAWSASGLFISLTTALDEIFHVPANRSLLRQRLTAVIMAVVLIVLIAISFLTSAVMRLLSTVLITQSSQWLSVGTFFLPFGLNTVIFALMFRYVPARRVDWDAIWPSAILGGAAWELLKTAFGSVLTNVSNYQFIYGTLSTGILLLFWAYLISSVFLLSAELCAQLNQWLLDPAWQADADGVSEPITPSLPAPPAVRSLPDGNS